MIFLLMNPFSGERSDNHPDIGIPPCIFGEQRITISISDVMTVFFDRSHQLPKCNDMPSLKITYPLDRTQGTETLRRARDFRKRKTSGRYTR